MLLGVLINLLTLLQVNAQALTPEPAVVGHTLKNIPYQDISSGSLYFKNDDNTKAQIKIFSLTGKLLYQFKIDHKTTTFNTNHLNNGLYFIEISEAESRKIKREKLVIKN